jgi:hypothetical protein
MSKPMRVLILQVAMLLLAAPVLAKAAPGRVANEDAGQATNVYAKADDVDCSKLDNDNARKQCREAKLKNNNDTANVDCSKLDSDKARKQCREAKAKQNDNNVNVDCSKLNDDDARKKCREAKVKN